MLSGGPWRTPDPKQRWLTFHKHAKVIVTCDFFVVVTASFRTLYVFVIMELEKRRFLRQNMTAHPTRGVDHASISRGASGRASLSIRDLRPG
jgi:putative transposase